LTIINPNNHTETKKYSQGFVIK